MSRIGLRRVSGNSIRGILRRGFQVPSMLDARVREGSPAVLLHVLFQYFDCRRGFCLITRGAGPYVAARTAQLLAGSTAYAQASESGPAFAQSACEAKVSARTEEPTRQRAACAKDGRAEAERVDGG
jgi:hypothetical protein